jgi:hypothetical protein
MLVTAAAVSSAGSIAVQSSTVHYEVLEDDHVAIRRSFPYVTIILCLLICKLSHANARNAIAVLTIHACIPRDHLSRRSLPAICIFSMGHRRLSEQPLLVVLYCSSLALMQGCALGGVEIVLPAVCSWSACCGNGSVIHIRI